MQWPSALWWVAALGEATVVAGKSRGGAFATWLVPVSAPAISGSPPGPPPQKPCPYFPWFGQRSLFSCVQSCVMESCWRGSFNRVQWGKRGMCVEGTGKTGWELHTSLFFPSLAPPTNFYLTLWRCLLFCSPYMEKISSMMCWDQRRHQLLWTGLGKPIITQFTKLLLQPVPPPPPMSMRLHRCRPVASGHRGLCTRQVVYKARRHLGYRNRF